MTKAHDENSKSQHAPIWAACCLVSRSRTHPRCVAEKQRESSSTEKAQMAVIAAKLTMEVSCAHENLNKAGVTALFADKKQMKSFPSMSLAQ